MLLYKYRPIDEWTLKGLKEKTIHFTCPADYNDPFDCRVNMFIDGTDDDWEDYRVRMGWTTYKLNGYRALTTIKKENSGAYNPELRKHYLLHSRISCFSETCDNILMWSHYADCHKGICLIFEATDHPELPYITLNENDYYHPNQYLMANQSAFIGVNYNDIMPSPYDHLKYDNNQIGHFMLTKSTNWVYEKEWRLITTSNELKTDNPRYLDNQLKGIIFGLNCPLDKIKEIRDLASDQNLDFYMTRALDNEYKVGFVKIK